MTDLRRGLAATAADGYLRAAVPYECRKVPGAPDHVPARSLTAEDHDYDALATEAAEGGKVPPGGPLYDLIEYLAYRETHEAGVRPIDYDSVVHHVHDHVTRRTERGRWRPEDGRYPPWASTVARRKAIDLRRTLTLRDFTFNSPVRKRAVTRRGRGRGRTRVNMPVEVRDPRDRNPSVTAAVRLAVLLDAVGQIVRRIAAAIARPDSPSRSSVVDYGAAFLFDTRRALSKRASRGELPFERLLVLGAAGAAGATTREAQIDGVLGAWLGFGAEAGRTLRVLPPAARWAEPGIGALWAECLGDPDGWRDFDTRAVVARLKQLGGKAPYQKWSSRGREAAQDACAAMADLDAQWQAMWADAVARVTERATREVRDVIDETLDPPYAPDMIRKVLLTR